MQLSDLEHTTNPRLSAKVQARKQTTEQVRGLLSLSRVWGIRARHVIVPLGVVWVVGSQLFGGVGMAAAGAQNKSKVLTGRDILQSIAAPLRDGPYSVLFRCFMERCFVRIVIRRINRFGFAPSRRVSCDATRSLTRQHPRVCTGQLKVRTRATAPLWAPILSVLMILFGKGIRPAHERCSIRRHRGLCRRGWASAAAAAAEAPHHPR